jgi:redox-sensitive bicupin YhaK (pirin superfamily)
MKVRRSHERGLTEIGWLTSRHSFSFGEYVDPEHSGFRSLRVINDDWVAPGEGFGMHGHRDMEILTLVLEGSLEHQDSLGHRQILRPGEVQVMSAGSGIRHSEYNPSREYAAHFLQIWIEPHTKGLPPRYEQREFPLASCRNSWLLLAGPENTAQAQGTFAIFQKASVSYGAVTAGHQLSFEVLNGGSAWMHVIDGDIRLAGTPLRAGDAVAIEEGGTLVCEGITDLSELLLFSF